MKVSEAMSTKILGVPPHVNLAETATLMGEQSIGSALVLEGDTLVGIVTERDIVRALSSAHDAPLRQVDEWMTPDPVTIEPGREIGEACQIMLQGGFRHLPVVEGGKAVGMLSMRDVATALHDPSLLAR